MSKLKINNREISSRTPPYVIAEISGNHNGDVAKAISLIAKAHAAGANAVKFQAYTPDTITLDHSGPGFDIKNGPWKGQTLYDLYKKSHTPFKWFPRLFRTAQDYGMTAFASVFDKSSVDMLEKLDCPVYKIASFELVDIPLIEYVAQTNKPMILSTGMASDTEINEADDAIKEKVPRAFLHCVSGYPTPISQANLTNITRLKSRYETEIGLSDHSQGVTVPIAAIGYGATLIEKHLTLDKEGDGPDDFFSLEPHEFQQLVQGVNEAWAASKSNPPSSEERNRPYRRSLYVIKDIDVGDIISERNVASIRPGYGLPPKMLKSILGLKAVVPASRGEPLSLRILGWDHHESSALSAPSSEVVS